MKTLSDFQNSGTGALEWVISHSPYGSVEQAIASLTLFSHPGTVAQTNNRALFPMVRDMVLRGQAGEIDGRPIHYDDNSCVHATFLWANGLPTRTTFGKDIQSNHVYSAPRDPDAYTCLANICVTPAFLAKLTDVHYGIQRLLQWRVRQLYTWWPAGRGEPQKPDGYDALEWASTLPAVQDVAETLRQAMATKPKHRTVKAAQALGSLFDNRSAGEVGGS